MSRRLAATAVAIVALTSACGGGASDDAAPEEEQTTETTATVAASEEQGTAVDQEVVDAAVWTTTQAGTARYRFVSDAAAGGGAVSITGEGVVGFDGQPSTMELDVRELLEATGLSGMSGSFEAMFHEGTAYVNAGIFEQLFPSPTPWLRLDASDMPPAQPGDTMLGGLEQIASYDPALPLRFISGLEEGSVRATGESTVGSESTSTYTGTVDLEAALAETDPAFRDHLLRRLGGGQLPVEFEIDDDHHLRRMVYTETAATGGYTITHEYADFGVEQPAELPTDEETSPFLEIVPLF